MLTEYFQTAHMMMMTKNEEETKITNNKKPGFYTVIQSLLNQRPHKREEELAEMNAGSNLSAFKRNAEQIEHL